MYFYVYQITNFGTHIYIDQNYNDILPPPSILHKNRFKEGKQPDGWITITEWRNKRKKKNGALGRCWYNDGERNYYLHSTDPLITELSLMKKRLNLNNCCCFSRNSV